jgi:hypothetical protein
MNACTDAFKAQIRARSYGDCKDTDQACERQLDSSWEAHLGGLLMENKSLSIDLIVSGSGGLDGQLFFGGHKKKDFSAARRLSFYLRNLGNGVLTLEFPI